MAALKVKDGYGILAPGCHTFSLECLTHISDPELLLDRLWYLHLVSHLIRLLLEPLDYDPAVVYC